MSTITVFNASVAMLGDFSIDDDAIALIECDDTYDDKALDLKGSDDVENFTKKAKRFKFFCEVTEIN